LEQEGTDIMPHTRARQLSERRAAKASPSAALSWPWVHLPGTVLGLVIVLGAASVAAEAVLVVLLTQVQPEGHAGSVIAALVCVALLVNFVVGCAAARQVAADRHRAAAMTAELAEISRDQLSELAMRLESLRRVATLVARGGSPSEVFSAVAEEMAGCLKVRSAEVFRYEDDGAAIVVVAAYTEPGAQGLRVGERITLEGRNISREVLRTGGTVRMDSFDRASGSVAERMRELSVHARVGAPIVVDERVWGVAIASTSDPDPLPPDTEQRIAEFADLIATAIAASTARAELIASRARIVAAADDARRRLERDLHDGAQQRLVSLGFKARLAQEAVPADCAFLRDELSELVAGLTGAVTELQEISRGVHPAVLSRGGLAAALKMLARRSAVPVNLDIALEHQLPEPVQVAAYYVVAEGLTNTAKHAQASQVTVRAQTIGAEFKLSICDDGIGVADSRRGSGLVGLKDRIEVIGGQMLITSNPGMGMALHMTVPLDR
jgi:signal transduction histidine kinase